MAKAPSPPDWEEKVKFQKAIVSAVLHGYFFIEPFKEHQPLDSLITLLQGVGLEVPNDKSRRVLYKMDEVNLDRLRWILDEASRNVSWLRPNHPKRSNIARLAFTLWALPEFDQSL